jgi:hypothetical protein
VVSFHDPPTGEEFTVTNDGEVREHITKAWPGRAGPGDRSPLPARKTTCAPVHQRPRGRRARARRPNFAVFWSTPGWRSSPRSTGAGRGRCSASAGPGAYDEGGHTSTNLMPVVTFTPHVGTAVTAYCGSGLPDPAGSYGRDVTIPYSPDDPADFSLDVAGERSSRRQDVVIDVLALVVVVAAVVVGAVRV